MSTVTREANGRATTTPRYDYPEAGYDFSAEKGAGWLTFSAIMLGLAGLFGFIDGLVAVSKSSFYVASAHFVFSDLNTWGWIIMAVGAVAMLSAFGVLSGSQWARWTGIVIAGLQAVAQLLMIQAYPFWSLCVFAIDLLVIYGLATYGGSRTRLVPKPAGVLTPARSMPTPSATASRRPPSLLNRAPDGSRGVQTVGRPRVQDAPPYRDHGVSRLRRMRSALVAGGRRSLKGESWKDPRCVFLNILVGIDGSPSSQRALDHAVELTRAANAKLTLMTVAPPTSSYVTLAGMSAQTMTDELDKWAAGVLDEATRAVPDDVIARRVQSRGHAGPEILKELGRGGYDLIVLGTRGRGRTQEGLLGSVNGYIHFHAKVPLLSVPDESGD